MRWVLCNGIACPSQWETRLFYIKYFCGREKKSFIVVLKKKDLFGMCCFLSKQNNPCQIVQWCGCCYSFSRDMMVPMAITEAKFDSIFLLKFWRASYKRHLLPTYTDEINEHKNRTWIEPCLSRDGLSAVFMLSLSLPWRSEMPSNSTSRPLAA